MMRIFLFLLTNIAVLIVAGIVLNLLGVGSMLDEQGVNLDLGHRLVFTAVFAPVGTLIILVILKAILGDLRVDDEAEGQGLDLTEHSEAAYNS